MSDEQAVKQILMIDDDKFLRTLVARYLERDGGYQVFQATNGKEGQERLKIIKPDLIILDMMMPVLDGMGFLRWLRQEAKMDQPVLVLSGLSKAGSEAKIRELGASDVLFKPAFPREILKRVQKILEKDGV
jgi:DNA-binding response OmpR family regulator